jgi:hypothetical protein
VREKEREREREREVHLNPAREIVGLTQQTKRGCCVVREGHEKQQGEGEAKRKAKDKRGANSAQDNDMHSERG